MTFAGGVRVFGVLRELCAVVEAVTLAQMVAAPVPRGSDARGCYQWLSDQSLDLIDPSSEF